MRKLLPIILLTGWAIAQAPVVPAGQTRVANASQDVGSAVGAPLASINSATGWAILSEDNTAANANNPNVGTTELYFNIDAQGQIRTAQSLAPFFNTNLRASLNVTLDVQAFNNDGPSAVETVTITVVEDKPFIFPNQSRSIAVDIGADMDVGEALITLNSPTYFYIAGGNTFNAFKIGSDGVIKTNRNLDGLPWINDPETVSLSVVAGNIVGESNPTTVDIFISIFGTTRCGDIPETQTRFVSVAANTNVNVGFPIDFHNLDSIWIEEVYIDNGPNNLPALVDPEIATALTINPGTGQIITIRPLADFVDPSVQDDIHKLELVLKGHVNASDCPEFVTQTVFVYILPNNTGIVGGDDDDTTPTGFDFGDVIDDVNLRTCIKENLGLSNSEAITADLVFNTTSINCFCQGITDIDGLQYFKNLTSLNLGNNFLVDIRHISNLTALTDLKMSGNFIDDLETNFPFASLTSLVSLDLSNNQIGNTTAFATLSELSFISLANNNLSNIESLAANTGVGAGDVIILDGNCLTSIAAINQIGVIESRGPTLISDNNQTAANCPAMPITPSNWPTYDVADFTNEVNLRQPCNLP